MSSPKHYSLCKTKCTDEALVKSLAISIRDWNNGAYFRGCFGRIDAAAASDDYFILVLDVDGNQPLPLPSESLVGRMIVGAQKVIHTLNNADSTFDIDIGDEFIKATNGIVVVASTTEFAVNPISTAHMSCTILYK